MHRIALVSQATRLSVVTQVLLNKMIKVLGEFYRTHFILTCMLLHTGEGEAGTIILSEDLNHFFVGRCLHTLSTNGLTSGADPEKVLSWTPSPTVDRCQKNPVFG